jgi:hypothetical protein
MNSTIVAVLLTIVLLAVTVGPLVFVLGRDLLDRPPPPRSAALPVDAILFDRIVEAVKQEVLHELAKAPAVEAQIVQMEDRL